MHPLLSILIPVFNDDAFLEQCLNSIIIQHEKNYEVVIVDDGSTDMSSIIGKMYAMKNTRFRFLSHPSNMGTLIARKTAVIAARGRYCIFLDADDYLPDDRTLERIVNILKCNTQDILQYSVDVFSNDDSSEQQTILDWLKPYDNVLKGSQTILENCFVNNNIAWNLCGKCFKTDLCQKAILHAKDVYCVMAEDTYCFFLISYYATSYRGLKTPPLYIYRLGTGISTGSEMNLQQLRSTVSGESDVLKLILQFLEEQNTVQLFQPVCLSIERQFVYNAITRYCKLAEGSRDKGWIILGEMYSFLQTENYTNLCSNYN